MNRDLRRKIVDMVMRGRDGHIPSAFSIVDIISLLYSKFLRFDPLNPDSPDRDRFILSKGHGCLALYVVLAREGILSEHDIELFCKPEGILGEHPDCTKVAGIEASTGSLGHGLPIAVGLTLGQRIQGRAGRTWILIGDGECQEGTVWEAAAVASNLDLGQLCAIIDWNGSAAQLMPRDDLPAKWRAFGWDVTIVDGHSEDELSRAFSSVPFAPQGRPTAIIAKTIKGKGVSLLEGHGKWHHRIPNDEEYKMIMKELR